VDRVNAGSLDARTIWQAHEIDATTVIEPANGTARAGDIVDVVIGSAGEEGDLTASLERVASRAAASSIRVRPPLPLASIGSYGR
jgi:hypothetical protein